MVGKLALDDEVENAVTIAGCAAFQNFNGDIRPSVHSRIGKTTKKWIPSANSTVPT